MVLPVQLLASFILTILVLFVAPARAAAPYQGIYLVIDPYTPTQITLLQGALPRVRRVIAWRGPRAE
jgi:hypothetical protein